MRTAILATLALFAVSMAASAQITFSLRLGDYPTMEVIPGYPVYYAPGLDYNYFFYDDRYWVYQDENWYSSSWYDGPWDSVNPYSVPTFMLQVPVRYYRRPPVYFRGWQGDNAPHWGDHWGRSWSQQRSGWDRRPEGPAPAPARLPEYQRQFRGNSYPAPEQQRELQRGRTTPASAQEPRQRSVPAPRPVPPAPERRELDQRSMPQQVRQPPESRPGPTVERRAPDQRPAPLQQQQQQRRAPEQHPAAPQERSAPKAQDQAPTQRPAPRPEPRAQQQRPEPQQQRQRPEPQQRGNDQKRDNGDRRDPHDP